MTRRIGFLSLLVVIALVALYFWRYNPMALDQPTDSELLVLFHNHQKAFEKLRFMAMQDAGSMLYFSKKSLQHSSLDDARRKEYLQLMSFDRSMTIGATQEGVTFHFAGGGVGLALGPSWTKGITYLLPSAKRGCTIVKSLNGLGMNVPDGVYIMPIQDNWYLVFSKLD